MIKNGESVLVITSSSTGNNIFATPSTRFLRRHLPGSRIDVVCLNDLSAQVFDGNSDVNAVFVIDAARKFDQLAVNYDHVIPLHASALKRLHGYKTAMHALPAIDGEMAHADQLLQHVSRLVDAAVLPEDRQYFISTGDVQALLSLNALQDNILVSIHLGCARTLLHGWKFWYRKRAEAAKLWPVEAYIELGKKLVAANPNIRIILTGTKNEQFLAKAFSKEVGNTTSLVGKTSVRQIKDLLERSDLFIAQDCGILHVAAATQIPIVSLFGPTSHVRTGPYPTRPQHCTIIKETMAQISVEEVFQQSLTLLNTFKKENGFIAKHIKALILLLQPLIFWEETAYLSASFIV